MYILRHITGNWKKIIGTGTLYALTSHKFITFTTSDHLVRYIVLDQLLHPVTTMQ